MKNSNLLKIKLLKFFRIILILVLLPSMAWAFANRSRPQFQIDSLSGSFHTSTTELQSHGFRFLRSYSSRSLYSGIFGFGWCSNLEIQLQRLSSNEIQIFSCDLQVRAFYRPSFAPELKRSLSQILIAPEYQPTVFRDPKTKETLMEGDNFYLWTDSSGTQLKFSKTGQLLEWVSPEGEIFQLKYDSQSRWTELKHNEESLLQLVYPVLGERVSFLKTPQTRKTYIYNERNLSSVLMKNKILDNYAYSELENMTQVKWGDQVLLNLQYNERDDRIQLLTSNSGCQLRITATKGFDFQKVRQQTSCPQQSSQTKEILVRFQNREPQHIEEFLLTPEFFHLIYNSKGQLTKISKGAEVLVELKYETDGTFPKILSKPGVGFLYLDWSSGSPQIQGALPASRLEELKRILWETLSRVSPSLSFQNKEFFNDLSF